MASVIDKLKKRRSYPITIDGETFHIRAMTLGEMKRMESIDQEKAVGFMLGSALVEPDTTRSFPQAEGETDEAFADRVAETLADTPSDTIRAIGDRVQKLNHSMPSQESLAKN